MKQSLACMAAVLLALGPAGGHAAPAPAKRTGPSGRCIALTQGVTDAAKVIALAQVTPPPESPPSPRQLAQTRAGQQRALASAQARYRAGGCGALQGSANPADYLPAARRCVAETTRETAEMESKFNDQFKNQPHAAPDPPLDPALCSLPTWTPEPTNRSSDK